MLNFKEILTVIMILFAVIDILGATPTILMIRQRSGGHIHPEKTTLASFIIMLMYLFVGDSIIEFIGISVSDFAIAGSLILFFIALEMILGIQIHKDEEIQTASVVPVSFPLIAGTGSLTTLLSIRSQYALNSILIAIVVNMTIVYIVLRNLDRIEAKLGRSGIAILKKVFGVVVLSIAIKLFRSNTNF
jgi:multiple antibiotic resistance protein